METFMRIRLRTLMAGPGGVRQPGEVFDATEDEAFALVLGRYAEFVDPPAPGLGTTLPADEDPEEDDFTIPAEVEGIQTGDIPSAEIATRGRGRRKE